MAMNEEGAKEEQVLVGNVNVEKNESENMSKNSKWIDIKC